MSDCVFCRILDGQLPASFVYRDERCAAFMDIRADGEAAMQEVFHVHLHVFPRFHGDGFGLKFSPEYYTRRPDRSQLDQVAAGLASLMSPSETVQPSDRTNGRDDE